MTKVVIIIKGGLIQAIHSNKNLQYIIVDEDLNEENRISDVYEQDSLFPEYFDILDSEEDNNVITGKFVDTDDQTYNVQPEISLEDSIKTIIKHGYIKYFWHEEDIKTQAGNMGIELTYDQMNDIITLLENTDASDGINWDTISVAINEVCRLNRV